MDHDHQSMCYQNHVCDAYDLILMYYEYEYVDFLFTFVDLNLERKMAVFGFFPFLLKTGIFSLFL